MIQLKQLWVWLVAAVTKDRCPATYYPYDMRGGFRCSRFRHHPGLHCGQHQVLVDVPPRQWP